MQRGRPSNDEGVCTVVNRLMFIGLFLDMPRERPITTAVMALLVDDVIDRIMSEHHSIRGCAYALASLGHADLLDSIGELEGGRWATQKKMRDVLRNVAGMDKSSIGTRLQLLESQSRSIMHLLYPIADNPASAVAVASAVMRRAMKNATSPCCACGSATPIVGVQLWPPAPLGFVVEHGLCEVCCAAFAKGRWAERLRQLLLGLS
jgi:hypothetical protein